MNNEQKYDETYNSTEYTSFGCAVLLFILLLALISVKVFSVPKNNVLPCIHQTTYKA